MSENALRQAEKKPTYHKLGDTAEAVLTAEFLAANAYVTQKEGFQISNLMIHLKELEKGQPKMANLLARLTKKKKKEVLKSAVKVGTLLPTAQKQKGL